MTRPYSWYPLASSDPVPGDPSTVRIGGDAYLDVAGTIASAAQRLREIAQIDGSTSQSVEMIRDKATEVAGSISKAHDRYTTTGQALVTYASELSQAQAESEAVLRAAQNAQSAIDSAELSVRRAAAALEEAEPADQAALRLTLNHARSAVVTADTALAHARTDLQRAIDLRDRAAQQAITAIEGITGSDDLNDTLWDNLHLSEVFSVISDIAGLVASVAGILALALCWVPVLGEALATVALIASAVKLVADFALALAGDGSWSDVAWGVVAVASFGIGKVLAATARGMTTSASGVARLEAGRAAATSVAERTAAGLPTTSSAATIRALVGDSGAALSRNGARSMAGAGIDAGTWGSRAVDALRPSTLAEDLSGGWRFATDPAVRTAAWTEIRASFGVAGRSPEALFAATQADSGLVNALARTSQVSPVLVSYSPAVSSALGSAQWWRASSAAAVTYGAYDQTFGVQQTLDAARGAGYQAPAMDSVRSVIDLWGPTSAETLQLAK
ncbi:hypothetical protein BH11ACT1_BH11ACT1_22230 [soil metagenome]